jgi:hypothetical protein
MTDEKIENSNQNLTIDGNIYAIDSISDAVKATLQTIQMTHQGVGMISIVCDAARAKATETLETEVKPKLPEPIGKVEEPSEPSEPTVN